MTIKIGFTGTRKGMTPGQEAAVGDYLRRLLSGHLHIDLHHGDCVGADEQVHRIAVGMQMAGYTVKVVGHPPVIGRYRARCDVDEERKPLPYIQRNRAIVDEVDLLVAASDTPCETLRSGTWSTVRYARERRRDIVVFFPDGHVDGGYE